MPRKSITDPKYQILEENGILNTHSDKVQALLFKNHPFFDARDLVQVKYEMLRAVEKDKESVADTARVFGFSRVSFYKTREEFNNNGMEGLLPKKRGPQGAHKLTKAVMDFILEKINKNPDIGTRELLEILESEMHIRIHRRTLEKVLAARKKKHP